MELCAGSRLGFVVCLCGTGISGRFVVFRRPGRGCCYAGGLAFCALRWLPWFAFVLYASPSGVFGFALASGGWCLLRKRCGFACVCAGIRDLLACFTRRPCAGRHLLFFAAAKKSRQKKAANTANISPCLRAPNGSYASNGGVSVQRMLPTLRMSASPASNTRTWASGSEWYVPPRWQTVCRLSCRMR